MKKVFPVFFLILCVFFAIVMSGCGGGGVDTTTYVYNSPYPTPTGSPTNSPSPTVSPTISPSPTPTISPSPTPTISPSPTPTISPSPSPQPTDLPGAPTNLTRTTSTWMVLNWDAPSSEGSSPITGYRIYRGVTDLSFAGTSTTTSFDNSGYLDLDKNYNFQVSAVNSYGEGPRSQVTLFNGPVSYKVYPENAGIHVGDSVTYTLTGLMPQGDEVDFTQYGEYKIDPLAGGSWNYTTYCSENSGDFTVEVTNDYYSSLYASTTLHVVPVDKSEPIIHVPSQMAGKNGILRVFQEGVGIVQNCQILNGALTEPVYVDPGLAYRIQAKSDDGTVDGWWPSLDPGDYQLIPGIQTIIDIFFQLL